MKIKPKRLKSGCTAKPYKLQIEYFTRRMNISKNAIMHRFGRFRTYLHYNRKKKIQWFFEAVSDPFFTPIYPFDPKPKEYWCFDEEGNLIVWTE